MTSFGLLSGRDLPLLTCFLGEVRFTRMRPDFVRQLYPVLYNC